MDIPGLNGTQARLLTGAGYVPIGMVAAHNRIADALSGTGPWMFFTFSGSDAMCAGADVVLNIMTKERLPVSTENLLSRWRQNGTKYNDAAQQQWSNHE